MIQKLTNKTLKITLISFIIFASIFTYTTSVKPKIADATTNTTKIRIVEKNVSYLYGVNSHLPVRMVDRLRDSNNNVVFCINFNLPSPNGLDYKEAERLDNATTFLLNAFYNGNSNLTGNKAYDEYLIQASIHLIKTPDTFSLTNDNGQLYVDNDGSYTTVNKIKALVTQAKKAGSPTTPAFDNQLKISNSNVKSVLSENKFISEPVTVTVKGSGVISAKLINATENSYIGDEQGNPIKEIKNNTKVTMVIPANDLAGKPLNPKIEITGDFKQAYQVAKKLTGQNGFQDIATYGLDEFKEKKTATFETSIPAVTGSIHGVKITDANQPLAGARIEVRDSENTIIEEVTTSLDGSWSVTNLSFGEYYWLETETVDGYVLNGEKHVFNIDYSNVNLDAGDFVNKLKKGFIEGLKVDEDTDKPLANAEFTLTDNEGQKQTVITNENGMFKFNIEGGKTYTLEETKLPEGYKGAFKQENITLDDDGQVFKIKAQNKIKQGRLEINKIDKQTGLGLDGAEFTLIDNNGEKQIATSSKGLVYFVIEANKVYSLEETKLPPGYEGAFKQENITLKKDEEVIKITVENTKKPNKPNKPLPQTGDSLNPGMIVGGSLIVIAVLIYLIGTIYLKRKKI
ncbi:hypothetical protein KLP99_001626 [Listeria monocytogenes]|nr:hypothetical protein [Listeria monocytogenes]